MSCISQYFWIQVCSEVAIGVLRIGQSSADEFSWTERRSLTCKRISTWNDKDFPIKIFRFRRFGIEQNFSWTTDVWWKLNGLCDGLIWMIKIGSNFVRNTWIENKFCMDSTKFAKVGGFGNQLRTWPDRDRENFKQFDWTRTKNNLKLFKIEKIEGTRIEQSLIVSNYFWTDWKNDQSFMIKTI